MAARERCQVAGGEVNKSLLPKTARADAELEGEASVMLHRLARKYRSEKIDVGKHRADFMRLKKAANLGHYNVTQVGLWRWRSGYDLNGFRNPCLAARELRTYLEICEAIKVRPGKFKFHGKVPKTATIVLCGASAPVFAAKALDFVNQSLGPSRNFEEFATRGEFIPDPLRPVPQGRIPVNFERLRLQADLFSRLSIAKSEPQFAN